MAGNAALAIVAIGLLFLLLGGLVFVVSKQGGEAEKKDDKAKSERDSGAGEVSARARTSQRVASQGLRTTPHSRVFFFLQI